MSELTEDLWTLLLEADRELRARIRAEHRETFGTGRLRRRYKRCHEIAGRAIDYAPEGTVMVQGIEDDRQHSWLELPDGRLWDPVTCEFGTLRPQRVAARFTLLDVARKVRETGCWDWWA
jgi:hypothetical protein